MKTILVIEDDRPLLDAINAKLEKHGFRVITARSVEQAFGSEKIEAGKAGQITVDSVLSALKHIEDLEKVDAVWLDHHLVGDEDGLDFIKKLKSNGGRWNKIPVLVVSNAASPKTIRSYLDSGANKYYVKSDHRLDEIIKDLQAFIDKPLSKVKK